MLVFFLHHQGCFETVSVTNSIAFHILFHLQGYFETFTKLTAFAALAGFYFETGTKVTAFVPPAKLV